jgi:FkbM family methyltransferase
MSVIYTLKNIFRRLRNREAYRLEKEQHKKMLAFYAQLIGKGDLVFDIGANLGNRIAPFLDLGAKVVAVEPQPKCIRELKERFGDSIAIEPKGVDEKPGTREMFVSSNTVLSTFSSEWIEKTKNERFSGMQWNAKKEIQMTTMDELIGKYGIPRFVKVDVEGFELNVLNGLSQKIGSLSFEYAVPEQTASLQKCLERLQHINPAALCNYSIGETMVFEMKTWRPVEEMIRFIAEPAFQSTSFGDIYVSN